MFPRKILPPFLLLCAVAITFVSGACRNSQAEVDLTESASAALVVKVSAPQSNEPISVAAVGDTMMGSTYQGRGLPEKDGAEMISSLAPIISSADIAFGNLEGPLI